MLARSLLLLLPLCAVSGCVSAKLDVDGPVPQTEDSTTTPAETTESYGTIITSSGGPLDGDWRGEWTVTVDYTANCDLGSQRYHQFLLLDIEEQGGTLQAVVDDYRMEGPDEPELDLVGTFPLSGNREEALASTDEDDTRIFLMAELMDDDLAHGILDGFFSDGDGDSCELEYTFVEMRR
jgi:hypothetical protein